MTATAEKVAAAVAELTRAGISAKQSEMLAAEELGDENLALDYGTISREIGTMMDRLATLRMKSARVDYSLFERRCNQPVRPIAELLQTARRQVGESSRWFEDLVPQLGWEAARINRQVSHARTIKFERGDHALVRPSRTDGPGFLTAYSFRTATMVQVAVAAVVWL